MHNNAQYSSECNIKIASVVTYYHLENYLRRKSQNKNYHVSARSHFCKKHIISNYNKMYNFPYLVAYAKARCEKEKPFEERFFPSRALPFPNLFEPL